MNLYSSSREKNKILFIGASGFVGQYFYNKYHDDENFVYLYNNKYLK